MKENNDKKCYKVAYDTRRQAWASSLHFYQKLGTFAGAYRCGNCNKFHLSRKVTMPPVWLLAQAASLGIIIPADKKEGEEPPHE